MTRPKVYADFHNADPSGRLRLTCVGTLEDLSRQQVELREGLTLTLYSDDLDDKGDADELLIEGIVSFSKEEHCWVASIDWDTIRHASEVSRPNGTPHSASTRQTR
jgi:hypothetical protein